MIDPYDLFFSHSLMLEKTHTYIHVIYIMYNILYKHIFSFLYNRCLFDILY